VSRTELSPWANPWCPSTRLKTCRGSNGPKKGQSGPVKAKALVSRTKKWILVFADSLFVIYINHIPQGAMVNPAYTRTALHRFMKLLKKKRLDMAAGDWFSTGTILLLSCRHSAGLPRGDEHQIPFPSRLIHLRWLL
jgi:hypothetical protein